DLPPDGTFTAELKKRDSGYFLLILDLLDYLTQVNMTLEEVVGSNSTDKKMQTVSQAVEELLAAARRQDCLTVGVVRVRQTHECVSINRHVPQPADPDSVVLCVLATDEEDEGDIALQIHFTLLQAFCCDNDINILRVSGVRRLATLLEEDGTGNEPRDLHCILVTNPPVQPLQSPALQDVSSFCEESRCRNQWVPFLQLQDR
uniref:Growth arrest and DNA damage inducible beta n=1 Tax=Scophthalmus maximus TaxID=52904 RepID=A0A8D3CS94_SCOMX